LFSLFTSYALKPHITLVALQEAPSLQRQILSGCEVQDHSAERDVYSRWVTALKAQSHEVLDEQLREHGVKSLTYA
jgi:hypothetical protein